MPSTRPPAHLPGVLSAPDVPASFESSAGLVNHVYAGPSRFACLPHASSSGGGSIAKSQDESRCAVAGRESLRILRVSDPAASCTNEHRFVLGPGGHRIDASRNLWAGSGLKVDSSLTDVVWGRKNYDNKLITSARNGDLILWDLNKSGATKYERRTKEHLRAINNLSYSTVLHFCISGSSDGDLRVWDLRDMKSVMHIHHNATVRTVIASPSAVTAYHVVAGLDNGNLYRWDLRVGQKAPLDRLPLAHAGPILGLDWCHPSGSNVGWLASAGSDRCVKVWNLNALDNTTTSASSSAGVQNSGPLASKPTYTLHASFPIRRVNWRPDHETELAIASRNEFGLSMGTNSLIGTSSLSLITDGASLLKSPSISSNTSDMNGAILLGSDVVDASNTGLSRRNELDSASISSASISGDLIEIWDVRRAWIAKWAVDGSCIEGGVSDITFRDSDALWVQHPSGAFSQMDTRHSFRPIDSVPHVAATWDAAGSLTFIASHTTRFDVPYDDHILTAEETTRLEKILLKKKLGDMSYTAAAQTVGVWTPDADNKTCPALITMAHDYRIEGADTRTICERNAQVAFGADDHDAGQIWMILASLLEDLVPTIAAESPRHRASSVRSVPHSTSMPTTLQSTPPKLIASASALSDPLNRFKPMKTSPGRASGNGTMNTSELSSAPHTDGFMNSSSPFRRRNSGSSSSMPFMRPSHARRQSSIGFFPPANMRRPSLTRSSLSTPSVYVDTGHEAKSHSSRHLVGGALDDSDSSSESSEELNIIADARRGALLQGLSSHRPFHTDWAEEELEDSASPASTDSDHESDHSAASMVPVRPSSLSRRQGKIHGSMAGSLSLSRKSLEKHDSNSSIQTIIAKDPSGLHGSRNGSVTAFSDRIKARSSASNLGKRRRSQAFSVNSGLHWRSDAIQAADGATELAMEEEHLFLVQSHEAIQDSEENYRMSGWRSLREGLEVLADSGNVQLCAMLSCIAPRELNISQWRASQFIESYIDLLLRFRLHGVAAYIRKYCNIQDVRQSTQLQTTIYTACAKCGKAMLQPASDPAMQLASSLRRGYNFCTKCKQPLVKCAVCRLPVRTLLFSCPVCHHGGHEECYRLYYMQRPLVELFTTQVESRGRSGSRTVLNKGNADETGVLASTFETTSGQKNPSTRIMGHPCAAGCGHHCWSTSERI